VRSPPPSAGAAAAEPRKTGETCLSPKAASPGSKAGGTPQRLKFGANVGPRLQQAAAAAAAAAAQPSSNTSRPPQQQQQQQQQQQRDGGFGYRSPLGGAKGAETGTPPPPSPPATQQGNLPLPPPPPQQQQQQQKQQQDGSRVLVANGAHVPAAAAAGLPNGGPGTGQGGPAGSAGSKRPWAGSESRPGMGQPPAKKPQQGSAGPGR
jgi:hypothetical protein